MPTNSRGGRNNNNPTGRNQYSDWGVMEMARERPIAAAAAAAGAAAAGLVRWSRRAQITDQLSNLSEQIGDWTSNMRSSEMGGEMDDTAGLTTTGQSSGARGRSAARGLSETGGVNASLGAHTGGGGTTSTASGRGRSQPKAAR
jgi:hypothetical protein